VLGLPSTLRKPLGLCPQANLNGVLITFVYTFYCNHLCKYL
jgi:hypothetical protein